MRARSRDRRTHSAETPATAEALAPEILDVVWLVAEILLDQRRREADQCRDGSSGMVAREDAGKAA